MDKFYVIRLINSRTGERGYAMDTPDGVMIALGFHVDITKFETERDARQFIKEKKIEKRGITAHIRDNQDLIEDEKNNGNLRTVDGDVFYIENKEGKKLHYDERFGYLFKEINVGYPVWYTEKDASNAIEKLMLKDAVVKKMENKK